MGNQFGVLLEPGQTVGQVAIAMREAMNERFPGVFGVDWDAGEKAVCLMVGDKIVLVWWDEPADEWSPARVQGDHMRCYGPFGYWLMNCVAGGVAKKLGCKVQDDGVGEPYKPEVVERWQAETFAQYLHRSGRGRASYAALAEEFRDQIPDSLLPWFVTMGPS